MLRFRYIPAVPAICVAAALVAMAGCGGGGGGGPQADIRGRVLLVTTGAPPNPPATVAAGGATAQTLSDGTFVLRNASASASTIRIAATGMKTLEQALPPLQPNTTNDLGDIFLTDQTYNADVQGRVLRADTLDPVAGATVRISGKFATTAADGTFRIDKLPVGLGGPDVTIGLVRATGFEDKALVIDFILGATEPPNNLVNDLGDILISPPVGGLPGGPTTIRGKVTLDGESSHGGVTVTLLRASDDSVVSTVLTPADGSYGFWVPVGQYRVRAERDGFQTQTVDANLVRLDRPITVNIVLRR